MAGGGAERVVSNLLPNLANEYEIYLVLMRDKIDYKLPDGIKVFFIENSAPFENGIKKLLKLPFLAIKYKKLCENLGIKNHFVWMVRPCFVAAIARILGLSGKFVFNECSTPSVLYKDSSFKSKISKFLIKKLYKKADFILPNSKEAYDDLACNFGIKKDKMSILYNAVDINFIEQKSLENIEFNGKFFLSVGRLDENKNHETLIRSYALIKEPKLDLIILGTGVLKDYLQNLINKLNLAKKVHLLGFDANPYKYMSKCEAFVFTSKVEGFSNVLIEALACGAFVISSDHKSGARELLGSHEWGILVPVSDIKSTAAAMQKVINEPNLVLDYKAKAKDRAKFFDKDRISKELIENLNEIYV